MFEITVRSPSTCHQLCVARGTQTAILCHYRLVNRLNYTATNINKLPTVGIHQVFASILIFKYSRCGVGLHGCAIGRATELRFAGRGFDFWLGTIA